jgi:hypothetical protein
VLALQIARLMRLTAERAGLHLSVRELLGHLAGIGETVLLYPTGGKGRPKAWRMLTETTELQDQLTQIFPARPVRTQALGHTPPRPPNRPPISRNTFRKSMIVGSSG